MNVEWMDRETLDRTIGGRIQPVDVVLDIGCGIRPQTFFRPRVHICCEPYPEYVRLLQGRFAGLPDVLVLQETGERIAAAMPDRSVDTIFLMDVIEHMEKEAARDLLRQCERIARRQVVVFTPLGFMPQDYETGAEDAWGLRGGEWQTHRSGWTPDDFGKGWAVLGSRTYHALNAKGEPLDPPFGAFWAIWQQEQITAPVKLAMLSHIFPPAPSGQAMALYRLLRDVRSGDYCLISREAYDPYAPGPHTMARLPAVYHQLPLDPPAQPAGRFGWGTVGWLYQALRKVHRRAKAITRIVREEGCGAVVACTGDLFDPPAGYLASRWARVPFYLYVFDDYAGQWIRPLAGALARRLEPVLVRGAAGVIVPNELLRDAYRRRYGVEPVIVRNPCHIPQRTGGPVAPWPAQPGEIRIVYTGAVYQAHYDAFRNLLAAIRREAGAGLRLHLYTAQPREELDREGIAGPIVYHDHLPLPAIGAVQQQADILFLPLAFDSPYPEVIRTSAPGKMGEYLASGRPILVHAPADSYVSRYFTEHRCGMVVDRNDPAQLADALRRLIDDSALRKRCAEQARVRAKADFGIETVRAKFLALFRPTGGG